ncbi:MAG: type II toxin-antitoxin system HipA family toxin [Salinibacterium sp.]|nr:MAG: type II toxin-antitoxin system HipA family toxin [Salinibacterium sp.]
MAAPAYVPVDLVEVVAWGQRVGAIAPGQRGAYVFEYDPAWIRGGIELAPAIMPLARKLYAFPGLPAETFHGLPPTVADSLPDRFGNSIVDAWLARNSIPAERVTALDRLAYLGERGMGALGFRPDRTPSLPPPTALDLGDLVRSARRAVTGSLASESESQAALRRIIEVGTSAGGARAKAIVNVNPATDEIRSGHVAPAEGFEPWLLKFDGVGGDERLGTGSNYGRVEYAYSLMARAAGIRMSPTRLLEENGRAHFMTRRFDRTDAGERLHLQSLCGMDGLDFNAIRVNDYSQLFTRIRALGLPESDVNQAYLRMVFNVFAANCDDHTKNFAFLMNRDGRWSLAPAYDLTHAYSPTSHWLSEHLMSVNGKFRDIRRADLLAVADEFGIERAITAIGAVRDAVESWPEFADAAGLSNELTDEIAKDFVVHPPGLEPGAI